VNGVVRDAAATSDEMNVAHGTAACAFSLVGIAQCVCMVE